MTVEAYVGILVVLLLLSAFFSSSETAFLSLQRVRLEHMVREGTPGAARVSRLVEQPRSLLSAILLGNNITNTGAAAVGTAIATDLYGAGAGVIVATVAIAVLLVLFGEVGPKTIALTHGFALSRVYAVPLRAWSILVRPIVWMLDGMAEAVLSVVGGGATLAPGHGAALTTHELRTAIQLGAESGVIEEEESSRLLGALTLERRLVKEIMVPRVDIVAAQADEQLRDVAIRMRQSGFLRLPVYDRSPDDVVGYIHISDVNGAQLDGITGDRVRSIMREPTFESEQSSIARVLQVMRDNASYLVALIDEHGATSGIVTLEDIMEEVIGDLRSESRGDAPPPEATPDDEGKLLVEGGKLLVDLSNELNTDLTDIDANTVAGLVLAYTRHIPTPGETVSHGGYHFTVVEADERRVLRVRCEPAPEPQDGPGGSAR